ncbi:MAG: Ig-like domain-containing protein [Xenococcaceae cyanobacterium]
MNNERLQPIDRVFIPLLIGLGLTIVAIGLSNKICGNNCFISNAPRVKSFSWKDKKVGAEDTAFILTFDRAVDRARVEKNLQIKPPLPGKISWSGKRLAYTLKAPAPYGEKFQVSLQQASKNEKQDDLIKPFKSQFSSRDRSFAYIGSQGEEQGKLILYNLTQQKKIVLTPPNLVVMDFKPYPFGDRLLFSAADRTSGDEALHQLNLYSVTTKLNTNATDAKPTSQVKLILDNKEYQNNKFDLSADGKTVVVQRLNRQNPEDFGLWIIRENQPPQPLKEQPGGDFLITPDSEAIAIAQGEGIALLPLHSEAKPLDFLPKFGRVLSFSRDGSAAAMVNFNTDNPQLKYTQSLYYVDNRGTQKRLFNIAGSLIDCQFNPSATHLYCLLTQLQKSKDYQEHPYIIAVEIKTAKVFPLLALPNAREVTIGIAPDGLGILFDRVIITKRNNKQTAPITNSGEAIADSNLWLLIPPSFGSAKSNSSSSELKQLPIDGFRPRWIP